MTTFRKGGTCRRTRVILRDQIIFEAEEEVQEELYREAVEREKRKLRKKKSFWIKIFPYRLVKIGERHE